VGDLKSIASLDKLREAFGIPLSRRLDFVAAAVHAMRVGSHPPALFCAIVHRGLWRHITNGDEDSARRMLQGENREVVGGLDEFRVSLPSAAMVRPAAPSPSDDTTIARRIMVAAKSYSMDPFIVARTRFGWDRNRWELATLAMCVQFSKTA